MRTGRPKKLLTLTDQQRARLTEWARRPKTAQALALRARIILACATERFNRTIAKQLRVHAVTVGKWRKRFLAEGLEGLCDEPRPGAPRRISDAKVEEVIARTLESAPAHATHWSTRDMAREIGVSRATVHRIWQAFGLQPHRTEAFKLSADPFFIEKVRDVVGLYLNPPDRALVLCVDEKTQVQALDRTRPLLPLRPGTPEQQTHDYIRHGVTSLFAALDIQTGTVIGECHRRHRQQELVSFLDAVESQVPPDLDIHLVMDNYATHKAPKVKRWFLRHPRYHLHFTPTSASWLNQVERFFAAITTRRIRRGTFESVRSLEKAIREYLRAHNSNPKPFVWVATADEIFANIKRFCERTSETGHYRLVEASSADVSKHVRAANPRR